MQKWSHYPPAQCREQAVGSKGR